MREMKNSGTEWLSDIPHDWTLSNIGSLYTMRNVKVSDRDYPPLSVTMKGVVPQLETAAKTDAHDDRKLVKKGDFAINSRSDRRGSCGIADRDGSVSLINTILAPRTEMNPDYYNWLFHSTSFADEFYRWGHGIVDDLWTTRWQEMKKIDVPVPSYDEQEKIAITLKNECSKVDELLANQEAQIEKLKAYKQSLITEVVTKGLDPNVPMKDSGVEWIGKIPQSWYVIKNRNIFRNKTVKGHGDETVLSVYRDWGVVPKDSRDDNWNVTSLDTDSYKYIEPGDLVINKMKAWSGSLSISDYAGIVSPAYYTCTVNYSIVDQRFIHHYLRNKKLVSMYEMYSAGMRIGQWDLSIDDFLGIEVAIPQSKEEQKLIADYLDKKCDKVDKLIFIKQQKIEKLNQYKKSLIYEYVTGKKEVM